MTTLKRQFGDLGEEIASIYLRNKGFLVIGRNYLKPYGEIDLIATKSGVIHFFEVKSVTREIPSTVPHVTRDRWNPAEMIHPKKLERMQRAINSYLVEYKLDLEWQIDAALVEIDEGRKRSRVEVIEGIS